MDRIAVFPQKSELALLVTWYLSRRNFVSIHLQTREGKHDRPKLSLWTLTAAPH
jgi:hypothetical protein